MKPDGETLVRMYEVMITVRQCEDRVGSLLMSGQVTVLLNAPRGQEAIAAAVGVNLRPKDRVVTTYRGMHDHIAKGVPLRVLWSEYLGKATAPSKGKGGPMHIVHPESGVMLTTGVVGSGIPIANGVALAAQLRRQDAVTVCNFGDGASNIGAFHEGLNLAALWQLPVVFVCQNNLYAEHTAVADHQKIAHIAERAPGYGMPGVTVDGSDPEAVFSAASEAIERARLGGGPTLIEAVAYRLAGHYLGDAMEYVPAAHQAEAVAADPVPALRARLIESGATTEDALVAIEARIQSELDDAVNFALSSPYPQSDEIYRDVMASQEVPV